MQNKYRTLVFSSIHLTSPLHIGSGSGDEIFSDSPVARDVGGYPFIPGSTLAGSFASLLDSGQKSNWGIGLQAKRDSGNVSSSSIVFDDAYPVKSQSEILKWPVEIRDHVSISRDTLSAEQDHHFSVEFLPVGTTFCFFCRQDSNNKADKDDFIAMMRRFLSKTSSLGAKKNAGHGQWRTDKWSTITLDLGNPDDIKKWMIDFHGYDWNGDWQELENTGLKSQYLYSSSSESTSSDDQLTYILDVSIKNGLYLSAGVSGVPEKGHPDLTQVKRPKISQNGDLTDEFIDQGSAIKGRIRSTMEMLLRTYIRKLHPALNNNRLFKVLPNKPTESSCVSDISDFLGNKDKKGGWEVEESTWKEADLSEPQDHIKLDEFTQHTIDGCKFDFEPLQKGKMKVKISLSKEKNQEWQKALMFMTVKLLSLNYIPWGGHASRGYIGAKISFSNESELRKSINLQEIRTFIQGI